MKDKKIILGKYIDRIAVLTEDTNIFGIKTLKIRNGFYFKKEPEMPCLERDRIDIAVVALFAFWHGYERLIDGLGSYYECGGKKNFRFHFVGDGEELPSYRLLVKKRGLNDHFRFYGMKDEEFLTDLYRQCAFGCCSLGAYKKELFYSCELKSREYLAAGLPLISACRMDIDDDSELKKYIVSFSNDDTPIDFFAIERAYDRFYTGKSDAEIEAMRMHIYSSAKRLLSMNTAMKQIVDYIEMGAG